MLAQTLPKSDLLNLNPIEAITPTPTVTQSQSQP